MECATSPFPICELKVARQISFWKALCLLKYKTILSIYKISTGIIIFKVFKYLKNCVNTKWTLIKTVCTIS